MLDALCSKPLPLKGRSPRTPEPGSRAKCSPSRILTDRQCFNGSMPLLFGSECVFPGCSWRCSMLLLRCRRAWCQDGSRQLAIRWCVCACVCPHQPRHTYGAFAAGFVKEQVEASEIRDPMSERLTRYRGGIGVLVHVFPTHCAGEMLMILHGESRASKLRSWQTAAGGCVVESR